MPVVTYNPAKIGTLIISYYRCGTHFLADSIQDLYPDISISNYNEICNDNTILELEKLTVSNHGYNVAILNNVVPKFYLTSANELLKKWHVVGLSRRNKVSHYISACLWQMNQEALKKNQPAIFNHHGTQYNTYKQRLTKPVYQPIDNVIIWLQEQLINGYVPCDLWLDYEDLPYLPTRDIQWQPNQYNDIALSDLFINHFEIQDLLENFRIE